MALGRCRPRQLCLAAASSAGSNFRSEAAPWLRGSPLRCGRRTSRLCPSQIGAPCSPLRLPSVLRHRWAERYAAFEVEEASCRRCRPKKSKCGHGSGPSERYRGRRSSLHGHLVLPISDGPASLPRPRRYSIAAKPSVTACHGAVYRTVAKEALRNPTKPAPPVNHSVYRLV